MIVSNLRPGDVLQAHGPTGPERGICAAVCPHPLYPGLALVVWRMQDGTWSHDALSYSQELYGDLVEPANHEHREQLLRQAFRP